MNAATSPEALNGLALLGKTSAALVVVVVLILVFSRMLKRLQLARGQSGQTLRVVSSVALGARERAVVVEVEGTWLVLGVSAGGISKLHELPAQNPPPAMPGLAANGGFAERLRTALGQAGKA